jgi:hypothetical protein
MMSEEKSDPIKMRGKDDQGTDEEGTHIPLTKEPQGSVKGKNKPREESGME